MVFSFIVSPFVPYKPPLRYGLPLCLLRSIPMPYLVVVTLLWALSFNFIGVFLANQVDSYFAVLTRVLIALLVFAPITRFRGVPKAFVWGVALCGALQFGRSEERRVGERGGRR